MSDAPRRPLPGLWKCIEADYLAWLGFVVPVIMWVFVLLLWATKLGGPEILNLIKPISIITIICLVSLALRYSVIRKHFAVGVEVPGRVVRYVHLQDLGRIIYTYTYLNKEFRTVNFVHHSMRTMFVEELETIDVLLNPARPHSALVLDLFRLKPRDGKR